MLNLINIVNLETFLRFYRAMHYKSDRMVPDRIVHSAVLRLHVARPSVTLVDQNHISWKS